ncbi:unnamed protein product [Zymoseptoria tritici ST99CH_3D1]|uniref:Major facilitator superfamily transporter n=1 Tax=Zymoseptoria tritici (strain CBS 115943 / IPO323) TaxID=336722 RepID=F9X367_ZYMTI|nr:putative major facilitator superfamily transporter [Zymoseptoria tritici IPO323]EGP90116.1 putative major facilitator superfamily transporter [Zymoseptoria tritici IPO323]SMR47854.1 unnamed protein product [Zymoseptoria tritici ST99CH_3D1]
MGRKNDVEATLFDQEHILPKRELFLVFGIMALSLLVCFIDQNGIGVLLPDIAEDLNAQSSISWAGTSALIANTVFQVLYGRLSDLFGRKVVLLSALVLLSLSDLACGLSVNSTMLYIFRGLAGVANGGITSLTMMIVSDVVTLQDRGKYQGILGSMVGLGNAAGPLIAAGFALHLTWRGLFYLIAPLAMVSFAASWVWLPSTMPKQDLKETLAKIDVMGLLFGTAAVILLLIPISDGGHSGTPWDSPMIIAMFVVGGLCLVIFLLIEWRWADLPMMPLSMFRNISVAAMLGQSFLLGMSYYSYIYFLPLYFQNVRGESPLIAACLQLPLVIAQTIASTAAGFYVSFFSRYLEVIYSGFAIWTLGGGLLIMADRTVSLGLVSLYLAIIGIGTGFVFQPTLVALQAQCPKAQRAVVTSNRNFIRSAGGAVGLAVSSAILSNVLKGSLPERLQSVANSVFVAPDLANYPMIDADAIADAYANASRAVFIFCVPLAGVAFLLSALIKDRGLVRQEEKESPVATQIASRTSDVEKGELRRSDDIQASQNRDEHELGNKATTAAPISSRPSELSLSGGGSLKSSRSEKSV